jgi:hypothetical protein
VLAACTSLDMRRDPYTPAKWETWATAKAGTPVDLYNQNFSRLVDKDGTTYFCLMDSFESSDGSVARPVNVPCWKEVPRGVYRGINHGTAYTP